MYELKTKKNKSSVSDFINAIEDNKRREDALILLTYMNEVSKDTPKMWGSSIIGYGDMKYTNSTKKEYDWFKFGFSPRKSSLTLYVTAYSDYLMNLAEDNGLKHGKGCIYIKDLSKVNKNVVIEMIRYSMKEKNG